MSDGQTRVKAAIARPTKANSAQLKNKILSDFYAFQTREQKRERLQELQLQFEADKERIARIKQNRRFRPY